MPANLLREAAMTAPGTAVEVAQAGFNLLGIPGVTPTTLVGAIGVVLLGWTKYRKTKDDGDGSLRTDLFKRISQLEKDASQERKDCAAELAKLRKESAADLALMQTKLDGMQEQVTALVRQLVQYQVTTGQAMPISARSPAIEHALKTLSDLEAKP